MAGINLVAARAGVSTASVSRVLSGKKVRDDVRDRVLLAVRELDYRPNRAARSLRSNKTRTLGLIVADIQNPYFNLICRAVQDTAAEHGYVLILCNIDEDSQKESTYLRLLEEENVAGVITAPTSTGLRLMRTESLTMPVVVIDRPTGGAFDSVVIDNAAAASDLTAHLLARGRRRIAGLFGEDSATGIERHRGYVAAHHAAGVELDPSLTRFVPPREPAGRAAALALLGEANLPDAIITSNALLAAGAFRALYEHNGLCPKKVAFASFDDAPWTSLVRPAVTVIEQPTHEIGRTATELLLSRIDSPQRTSRTIVLPHRLIIRESCGAQIPLA